MAGYVRRTKVSLSDWFRWMDMKRGKDRSWIDEFNSKYDKNAMEADLYKGLPGIVYILEEKGA